jgi:hypothetical protein
MKLTGENRSTRGETYPSATLCTTNPTWTDPGLNPGLRGERPATNTADELDIAVLFRVEGRGWQYVHDFVH